jgi:putative DNA primase/helicase
MKHNNPTPELARAALAHVPANLPRDDWARIGAAIKNEFPDSAGFDLFDTWSQSSEGYDAKATAQTWKSLKASGKTTIGTLFFEAKARGFDLAAWHKEHDEKKPKQNPEQQREADERRTREQAEARQREQARTEAAHARAAAEAAALWAQASDQGESGYLTRKGVQAYGCASRMTAGCWCPCATRGELRNVQTINASGGPENDSCLAAQSPAYGTGAAPPRVPRAGRVRGPRHGQQCSPGHGPPGCCGL